MKVYLSFLIVLSLLLGAQACSKKESEPASASQPEKKTLYYTCPMHPQIHRDEPGKCPICGMDLVPVHETDPTKSSESKNSSSTKVLISSEKQQLIGVKTTKVEQRPLVREIFATGQVAYHPELFSAQQEYLIALKTAGLQRGASSDMDALQNQLIEASRLRLLTLGMSEAQIKVLRKQGRAEQSLILPQNQGKSWVYASVNESDLPWIKAGASAKVFIPGLADPIEAQVDSITPVIDRETRSAQIRIQLPQSEALRPNLYLKLIIQAKSEPVLSMPSEAILDSGHQQLAFVDLGKGYFESRPVKIGRRGRDGVEVLSGLSLGESVVSSANFLIDSESKLKAAISGMEKHSHD